MRVGQQAEGVNILLVDDQPAKLLSYEVILAELGETLFTASSAREALEHLLRTEFAVVLIDVCMPELNGFELAQMIREHPRFQRLAIIFVSAIQIADPDMLRGYEAGAVDYVAVPVIPELLRAKVKIFTELYRKTRELERLNEGLERRVADRTAALQRLNDELEVRIEQRTREREQALGQLFEAQKLETIGQLTGGIAHDFNNLLMAVTGSLELLKKRLPEDPRTARLIDNAMQGAERGAALTQRLLAFARRQELKPEAVNFSRLCSGIRDLLSRALGPAVRINKNLPPNLWDVQIDANQLELALLNLAVNARDAMPLGGVLTISAEDETVKEAANRSAKLAPGDYLRITVSDTGTGMDEATLAKAAEPFFTTKGPGKGTGLGLSMVHGLAAQSGGALKLDSRPGEGTAVELWLPRATSAQPARRTRLADAALNDGPPRIVLLVDDDPLVCAGTAAMLEDLGHHVVETRTAAEAIEVLGSDRHLDLVITDYAMPVMNGVQLAERVRKIRPHLNVILATGYAELPPAEAHGLALLRLSKPYRQNDLAAAIAIAAPSPAGAHNVIPLRAT